MSSYLDTIPESIREYVKKQNIPQLRPSQEKAIQKGLFTSSSNQIIATPTASGKTFVAELAMLHTIIEKKKRVIYIVPLKALASEKFKEFKEKYGEDISVRISIGELQTEKYNTDYDLLLVTSEKLDSLIRHDKTFLENVGLVIADEIHLLQDEKRGPTLEILLSLFKTKYPTLRIIGLSATIGNAEEISKWLEAELIEDEWRPVELQHHILVDNEMKRYK